MKVQMVKASPVFGRSLRDDEISEFKTTLKEGKKLAGQTGNSIFIMPSTVLPQSDMSNTGVGNFASKEGLDYIDYMKTYLDFNVVEDLPSGQIKPYHEFYCNYDASALALGDQNINPQLLTTPEYSSILTEGEYRSIIKSNNKSNKDKFINWENVAGNGSPQNTILKKAHERFKTLDENSDLKKRYNKFITENEDWLNFPREDEPDHDFFKFKQFLADEHLAIGKKKLNERGIKLCGDCPINFTTDEVNAYPDAFKKGYYTGVPGWKIPSLDYDKILDETSDAYKLFKTKVQLMAKRYDMIRFDVGWNYITPVMTPEGETEILEKNKRYLNSALVDNIDKWVKEIKGEDFDLKNLIYEVEAAPSEFAIFKENSDELIEPLKNRVKIYSSVYMHNTWGSNDAYLKKGWAPDEFVIGPGNHDHQPLRQIANGVPDTFSKNGVHKNDTISPLAKILKLKPEVLEIPVEYAKAKFAEPMTAKNNMFFFMDVFGREERFNEHDPHSSTNFRRKVPSDFKKTFQDALHEGYGFNIMDSLEKIFKARELDKTNSELYSKIVKFRDILSEKETDVANAAEDTAADDIVRLVPVEEETKNSTKWFKSHKKLLFAGGVLAAAGGVYAIYKLNHKPEIKTEPKIYA